MDRADVVVVGAGVVGAATAWHLARAGRDVVVLDRFAAGHTRGSSHGAARIFRFAYDDRRYTDLARRALAGWREAEAAAGTTLLTRTGGVDHGDPASVDAIAANVRGAGLPVETLTPAEAAERWPALRFEGSVAYHPDTGRVAADAAVATFGRLAAEAGARFGYAEPAVRVEPRGDGAVVTTAHRQLAAPVVVVTAGAWAARLLAGLVPLPPLAVTREQPAFFASRDGTAGWPCFIHYQPGAHGWYGLDSPGEGVKVGRHLGGPPTDPDDDPEPDAGLLAAVSAYVERWLPGLDPAPVGVTTCLYTTTPSHDFVVDRVGPLVVGSACSGHGFKFAPETGRLLAALATDTP